MRALLIPPLLLMAACTTVTPVNTAPVIAVPVDVKVPFELSSGRPVVMAQIGNGEPIEVDFDTGSQGAVIPRALVDRLGLKVVGETRLGSPFGGEPVVAKLVSLGKLTIGGVAATDVTAVVQEDASFMGPDARLVVGPAQFRGRIVSLDYAARSLGISSATPDLRSPWLMLVNGLPEAEIEISGNRYPLHIDSGNPGTLMLPQSAADKLSPKPELREVGKARTVDKEFSIYAGAVNADARIAGIPVRLGEIAFADVPSANLGSQGLAQFTVVVDVANNRWQLVPPSGQMPFLTARPRPKDG
jgi:predicted aspartyl protease